MKLKKSYITIIIPTKNSSFYLDRCLTKIRQQPYKKIEIIIVDGKSQDLTTTKRIAQKHHAFFYMYNPRVKKGLFDATKKRNHAAKKAQGEFIYHYDADMEITKDVLSEAVALCRDGHDAVIVPEDSFGTGIWASAKNLERRFFWGDDTIESPRFFKTKLWHALNGYDENIAGGGDDRDIHQRLIEAGYRVGRTKSMVMHNEGHLTLWHLIKKQFMYKREVLKYLNKRPFIGFASYFPIRKAHITNWRMFAQRPKDTFFFFIMKTAEFIAGTAGIVYSLFEK